MVPFPRILKLSSHSQLRRLLYGDVPQHQMIGVLTWLVVFLVVGHPAKEASTKHDQPLVPCQLYELEQLHPFQVRHKFYQIPLAMKGFKGAAGRQGSLHDTVGVWNNFALPGLQLTDWHYVLFSAVDHGQDTFTTMMFVWQSTMWQHWLATHKKCVGFSGHLMAVT